MSIVNRFSKYMSMVKFSHTIFSLPFALLGFFYAISRGYDFKLLQLGLILVCLISLRNAAMSFNRIADRKYDALNPRTAEREVASGKIKYRSAIVFLITNLVIFITSAFFLNMLCFYLSFVAIFIVLAYSYTKRFTWLCHFFLGLGLAITPTAAYIAVTASFSIFPFLLSLAVFLWVSGFDIIYALQDKDFDNDNQLHSLPQRFGLRNSLIVSALVHLGCASFIILATLQLDSGIYKWIAAIIFISLLTFQHLIVKPKDLSRVNAAFFTTNGIASIIYSGVSILGMFL